MGGALYHEPLVFCCGSCPSRFPDFKGLVEHYESGHIQLVTSEAMLYRRLVWFVRMVLCRFEGRNANAKTKANSSEISS